MAFFVDVGPRQSRGSKLGEALGLGLRKYTESQKSQKQQGILSRALYDQSDPEELQQLPPELQLKIADYKQKQSSNLAGSSAFSKGYKAILEGDTDTFKSVIEDENTPTSLKVQLAQLNNQASLREDVKKKEHRTRQNMVQQAYSKAIANERGKLGKIGGVRKDEVKEINARIVDLEKQRQRDMQRILKNPNEYPKLSIWGSPASEYLPDENEDMLEETEQEPQAAKQKMRFDPKNPQHVAKAKAILAKTGGDKAKANKILAEEFDR